MVQSLYLSVRVKKAPSKRALINTWPLTPAAQSWRSRPDYRISAAIAVPAAAAASSTAAVPAATSSTTAVTAAVAAVTKLSVDAAVNALPAGANTAGTGAAAVTASVVLLKQQYQLHEVQCAVHHAAGTVVPAGGADTAVTVTAVVTAAVAATARRGLDNSGLPEKYWSLWALTSHPMGY